MDLDQLARTVKDLEYRVKVLERDKLVRDALKQPEVRNVLKAARTKATGAHEHWCSCGRDVCRAPDCPSHKPDPMER